MMVLNKYCVLIMVALSYCCPATGQSKYNLDFEQLHPTTGESNGWFKWSDYEVSTDANSHSGKYSGKIISDERGVEGRLVYGIPANYTGKTLQLEGFIRTKDVVDGFAGLFLKIESDQGFTLVFENMEDQNVTGTKDWKKYSISVPYPEKAAYIFIGGILSGKGEAWFDDFVLKIDGEDIQTLEENDKKIFKAKLDREFDVGSNVKIPKLDSDLISDLDLLGRIWGFLKYYHPEIAKGNYNWDFELFRFLPKYTSLKNATKRDDILVKWIKSYGALKNCQNCKETLKEAVLKPDLSWIHDSLIGTELKSLLLEVYTNRHQGEQYYVRMYPQVGNPEFTNEDPYLYKSYPDIGFRLLALYRYWNTINYFFPYKYLTDKDWKKILKEYIPKFLDASNELEYELAALALIGEVNDTHANIWGGDQKINNIRGRYYAPFRTRFIENKLVVTDFYSFGKISGLSIGDVITHIDNRTVNDITDSLINFYPASNMAAKMRDISNDILRSKNEYIHLTYISNDELKQRTLKLYEKDSLDIIESYRNDGDNSHRLLDGNIGYITLRSLKKEEINTLKEIYRNTKGIIIDIRNYPNTFVPFTLGPYFVSSSTPFVKFTKANINNPGEFIFTEPLEIPHDGNHYKGKLIVLINELSQSQSEYTAMAFKAGTNTTIIGSTTAGADGNVSSISLPGGIRTSISGIGVYYPDGTETQRIGIVPDIEIKPTIKGIKEGRDEVLERAIEYIKED